MKNKHLAKSVQEQCFYEFYRLVQYKCEWNNVKFITADRFYLSSKKCCKCGNVKKDLKLSDRIYCCPVCGTRIDKDIQASVKRLWKINCIGKIRVIDMYRFVRRE